MSDPFEIIILCHDVTALAVMSADSGTPLERRGGDGLCERAEFEADQIQSRFARAGFFDLIVEYFLEHLDLLRTQAKAK